MMNTVQTQLYASSYAGNISVIPKVYTVLTIDLDFTSLEQFLVIVGL